MFDNAHIITSLKISSSNLSSLSFLLDQKGRKNQESFEAVRQTTQGILLLSFNRFYSIGFSMRSRSQILLRIQFTAPPVTFHPSFLFYLLKTLL
ncbi:MAG: hypothetical protein A3D92_14030 [Bacteroidetes bacterium RIFCSPHIGHO2_02_FULL_44_7]|nr:MAG: hypothetical protein A3D92_14030 [Bacteroidetes bacterium RIFCSPHIGHO2_02_FULL_44_7]